MTSYDANRAVLMAADNIVRERDEAVRLLRAVLSLHLVAKIPAEAEMFIALCDQADALFLALPTGAATGEDAHG
jgi:hypothetical protein